MFTIHAIMRAVTDCNEDRVARLVRSYATESLTTAIVFYSYSISDSGRLSIPPLIYASPFTHDSRSLSSKFARTCTQNKLAEVYIPITPRQ
jgi:hypothetical protein